MAFQNITHNSLFICLRWHNIAWEPGLWRSVAVSGGDRPLKGLLRRLTGENSYCDSVERVALSGPGLTDKYELQLKNQLIFTNPMSIYFRALLLLGRKCPRLSHLRIVGGAGITNITNAGVVDLVTKCPRLLHLDLAGQLQ
jgi:F-box and leucine-rich repeat protein 7